MKKTHFIDNETLLNAENLNNIFIEPPQDEYIYLRSKDEEWIRISSEYLANEEETE